MDQVGPESGFYNRNWPSWVEAAKTNTEAAAFLRAYHSRPAEELYRISDDPYEKTNLADNAEHQTMLIKLRKMVRDRMEQVGDDESLSGEPRFLKDFKLPWTEPLPEGWNAASEDRRREVRRGRSSRCSKAVK